MINIIPLILIGVSFFLIIAIIMKKFSVLASLDVSTIPAEKEAKFKEQLIESRLNRGVAKVTSRIAWITRIFKERISGLFSRLNEHLNEMKKDYSGQRIAPLDKDKIMEIVERLFEEVKELDSKNDFLAVEEKLIEVIGIDSKNSHAFESLGELYYQNKKYEEAAQAFEHVLKLLKDGEDDKQAEIYFDLALTKRESGDIEETAKNIAKAVKFSPNNPRFLDLMLEISIMNKDRGVALDAFKKLAEVNPDNNKLEEWDRMIKEIE